MASRGTLTLETRRDDLDRFARSMEALSYSDGEKALNRALNRTATMAKTIVVRSVSRATSIKQARVRGQVAVHKATLGNHQATIVGRGTAIPLRDMGATQSRAGVRVRIYGNTERHRDMFIYAGNPRSGKVAFQGHVLRNSGQFNPKSGRYNLPFIQHGPSVPGGMRSAAVKEAFETSVATNLPRRLEHEIGRLLP